MAKSFYQNCSNMGWKDFFVCVAYFCTCTFIMTYGMNYVHERMPPKEDYPGVFRSFASRFALDVRTNLSNNPMVSQNNFVTQ